MAVRVRLLFASLGALACADAAAAQQFTAISPGGVPGIINEAPSPPLAAAAAPAAAPIATDIRADVAGPLALGTQVTRVGRNHVIDGGTRAGNNLFHSFSRFDLGQGDFARWVHSAGDPATIRNVINRVTGGDPSDIFGTLDSRALPNADFYFINPAGIIFGDGARIDVPAAAHFSTAQQLRFSAGPAFTISTPGGSTFSVANPAAFGFVGGQGDVVLDGVGNTPFTGTRLTLTGRNVTIENSIMGAEGFGVAAVGSGTAALSVIEPMATSGNGRARIVNSILRSRSQDGIFVSGGRVELDRASLGAALEPGPRSGVGGPIEIAGREVSIHASSISASTAGVEPAGDIRISGEDVRISGGSIVQSETDRRSTGSAGGIRITAGTLTMDEGSVVSTSTSTDERAGFLTVTARDVRLLGGSMILSQSSTGAAGGGGLMLIERVGEQGGRLFITGDSAIRSDTNGSGDAGGILILMDEVELRDGARISSDSGRGCIQNGCGPLGAAGNIRIIGGSLLLADGDGSFTRTTSISSDTFGGDGGRIGISLTGDLNILGSARISSDTIGAGRGGDIRIDARNVLVSGSRGGISATTFGSGDGGLIEVTARNTLSIENEGSIESGSGDSRTRGNAPPGQGDSGDIRLNAAELRIARGGTVSATTFTDGAGGVITARAGRLVMEDIATITSASQSTGRGGSIDIGVGELIMRGFAAIDTDALGNCVGADCLPGGAAGDINIRAGRMTMVGRPGPDNGFGDMPRISSDTEGAGDAGNITIGVDGLLAMDFAAISSLTRRGGDAGVISIDAGTIEMLGRSVISTNSNPFPNALDHGDAGEVAIAATGNIFIGEGSEVVSNTGGSGGAGQVTVATPATLTLENARLSSGSLPGATGTSGKVGVTADQLFVLNGSIETISRNTNRAGDIGIVADTIQLAGRAARIASINTSAAPGSAGTVLIETRLLTLSNGAAITTESATGPAGDILISMPSDGILTLESLGLDTPPSVITTSSGPGTGGQIAISRPRAIISNGGSILALGQQGGANVQLDAQYLISSSDRTNRIEVNGNFLLEAAAYDVSAGTVNRDLSVIDASGVLRGQCAAVRATGQVSQLVVRPIGPYGTRPMSSRPADRTRLLSAAELQESCS